MVASDMSKAPTDFRRVTMLVNDIETPLKIYRDILGVIPKNARSGICRVVLTLMLAPLLLLAPVGALPSELDNATWYKGWMAVKKHKVDPDADLSEWIFARIERMHNQGQKIPLTDEAGNNTGYTLSLESLTYEETQVPVLKIGVIEDRTGYTLAYSWADPGSHRVGLNVRWFQAGMTRIDEEHHE